MNTKKRSIHRSTLHAPRSTVAIPHPTQPSTNVLDNTSLPKLPPPPTTPPPQTETTETTEWRAALQDGHYVDGLAECIVNQTSRFPNQSTANKNIARCRLHPIP